MLVEKTLREKIFFPKKSSTKPCASSSGLRTNNVALGDGFRVSVSDRTRTRSACLPYTDGGYMGVRYSPVYDGRIENDCGGSAARVWLLILCWCANERYAGRCRRFYKRARSKNTGSRRPYMAMRRGARNTIFGAPPVRVATPRPYARPARHIWLGPATLRAAARTRTRPLSAAEAVRAYGPPCRRVIRRRASGPSRCVNNAVARAHTRSRAARPHGGRVAPGSGREKLSKIRNRPARRRAIFLFTSIFTRRVAGGSAPAPAACELSMTQYGDGRALRHRCISSGGGLVFFYFVFFFFRFFSALRHDDRRPGTGWRDPAVRSVQLHRGPALVQPAETGSVGTASSRRNRFWPPWGAQGVFNNRLIDLNISYLWTWT